MRCFTLVGNGHVGLEDDGYVKLRSYASRIPDAGREIGIIYRFDTDFVIFYSNLAACVR